MSNEDSTLTLSNCHFAFPCTKTWADLQKTDSDKVRFCETCEHCVHLCSTNEELREAKRQNLCVAIRLIDHDTKGRDGFIIGEIQVPYGVK